MNMERAEYNIANACGLVAAIAIGLLASLVLGGCKGRETLVKERVVYDTAWIKKLAQSERNDSVVYRERVEIVPRFIKTGDTTIINMDTTVVRLTERNVYRTYNVYSDSGRLSRSDVTVSKMEKVTVKTENKWRRWWQGLVAGVLLSLAAVFGKRMFCFIRRMAIRESS